MLEAWCCIPTYDHRSDRKALTLMDLRRQYLENEETAVVTSKHEQEIICHNHLYCLITEKYRTRLFTSSDHLSTVTCISCRSHLFNLR